MTRQLSVYPVPPSDGNPYIEMVGRELGALGVAVAKDNLRLGQPLNDLPTGSIVHFHWPSVIYASPDHRKAERRLDLWTSFLEEIGSRCRIVWTAHNLFPHDNPFPDLGREARRILRHCDHITVHCSRARDLLEEEFGPLPPVSVLPHPNYATEYPPPPDRQAARSNLQIPPHAFLFLMFGSLRDYKGIDRAIAAFREIELPHARLHIAGGKGSRFDLEPVLRHACEDSRITVLSDFVPRDAVAKLYAAADVSLHCYRNTLTSGSIPLAQSMGIAVVAPRVGCIEEMVPKSCGILYDPEAAGGLKAAMIQAMSANVRQMGREGRNFIANRTVQNFARELLAIYQTIAR
jgi:beta-1,4-mannosyltransferase